MEHQHAPKQERRPVGVGYALGAALLFGLSTPFSKLLLGQAHPALIAGLLYVSSGGGLLLAQLLRGRLSWRAGLTRRDLPWLLGSILTGGVLAPLLLMIGLSATPAATTSLFLNLEGVFTALVAWLVLREGFAFRIGLGMLFIVAGSGMLSWQGEGLSFSLGALSIAGACLCWACDNNLTQKISAADPTQIAMLKGLVAGSVNLALALLVLGVGAPSVVPALGAIALGFLSYGVSLVLFVLALRHLGTARTGAYFGTSPFVGAIAALLFLREPVGALFFPAMALMGVGVWLHLSERHSHEHSHEALTHSHAHSHDEHHNHAHEAGIDLSEPHTHEHTHEPLTHSHSHFPDIHHRHEHTRQKA